MKIGAVKLDGNLVMAPLAGITNLPFRRIVKHAGANLVCSEMISSNGLVYSSGRTFQLLDSHPEERPLSVQIFGSRPDIMAEAARIVEDAGADILDINFGCSVKKILKSGSGSALMREKDTVEKILKAVRQAIRIPLTIKIRAGWNHSYAQAFDMLAMAHQCGVDAITIHPRTATQGFRGHSDWSLIREIKKTSHIPVIGNGDIHTPEDAKQMLDETGCDAIMIGRAAIGNPLIFSSIAGFLKNGEKIQPDLKAHFNTMIRFLKSSIEYSGEIHGCRMMRSRLAWFVKGLPGSSQFRKSLTNISTEAEALDLLNHFIDALGDIDTIAWNPWKTAEDFLCPDSQDSLIPQL